MRLATRILYSPVPAHLVPVLPLTVLVAFCAGRAPIRTTAEDPTHIDVGQLWVEPDDLESRDLFHGPGGQRLAPDPAARFKLIQVDNSGFSPGYDVRDEQGTEWSVKLGMEAQPEVVASRVLWAVGYHQPPTYLVTNWKLAGKPPRTHGPSRFRRKSHEQKVVAEWSWYQNPFVSTQAFKGLLVANLILNNWDWKTSNNKIYEVVDGDGVSHRQYVVRDLGAALGKTTYPDFLKWMPMRGLGQGSRNDLEDFEEQGFIKRIEGHRVEFDYHGIYRRLVDTLAVDDVVWTCRLMTRISDEQWRAAFRAAGYQDLEQQRYITKLRSKIREGLALAGS